MSNPEDTTADNIVPIPQPEAPPAHLEAAFKFSKSVNDAVQAAQLAGVDQAQIYGILHFIAIQVEAPIRIIAHKHGQRMAEHIMGSK
jgi:hypothetical protein